MTTGISFPQLKEYIQKYQDPHAADSIMKIQKELDETKIVLHKTIESVLERGKWRALQACADMARSRAQELASPGAWRDALLTLVCDKQARRSTV